MHICVLIGHGIRSKMRICTTPLVFATKKPTPLSFDIFRPPIEGLVVERANIEVTLEVQRSAYLTSLELWVQFVSIEHIRSNIQIM
jgi:hypothetical protein